MTNQPIKLSSEVKGPKINFAEQVSEVRVEQIVAEERELAKSSPEVQQLKARTKELLEQMKAADTTEEFRELRNEVVVLNTRLVTQVLKKYGSFSQDKFQNGCVGLLKAADTFDSEKEVPFHNYAAFCIEMEIRAAFKKNSRMFESKAQGYLDSLDAPTEYGNGDSVDKHDLAEDIMSAEQFDNILEEADIQTLFYDIILPCIETYGRKTKDLDVELWRALELQYFMEMAAVDSQRQRITFTAMAEQLGSTPQNLRARHKKVMAMIKEACEDFGYCVGTYGGVYYEDAKGRFKRVSKREAGAQW